MHSNYTLSLITRHYLLPSRRPYSRHDFVTKQLRTQPRASRTILFLLFLLYRVKYLRSMMSMKDTTAGEIRVRLATARCITSDRVNTCKDVGITMSWRRGLSVALLCMVVSRGNSPKRFVCSVALYGTESWTLTKEV